MELKKGKSQVVIKNGSIEIKGKTVVIQGQNK